MDDYSRQQLTAFFDSIAPWRAAYGRARLHYLAIRDGEKLLLLSARIYMGVGGTAVPKERFKSGRIEAGQWEITQDASSIEQIVESLVASEGLCVEGHGCLVLAQDHGRSPTVAKPLLLHPEGITEGNRIAVLTIWGAERNQYLPQPETDWALKAGMMPFDSVGELAGDYGVGALVDGCVTLEVVGYTAIQVNIQSKVDGRIATVGVRMSSALNREMAQIGYRVIDKGLVVQRNAVMGRDLSWQDDGEFVVGMTSVDVPLGAVIQCIASYDGHAHNIHWFADPNIFQNPRAAALAQVDQSFELLRGYLLPEPNAKGRSAGDFEAAMSWVVWALGFAPASFGTNNKTRDAFDIVAVTPRGHFVVIECTLGLLRADSKLSKLTARATSLRDALIASNMQHLQVLPVMVSAMTRDQIQADLPQAVQTGVYVVTREDLEQMIPELLRLPDPDGMFERAIQELRDKQLSGKQGE